MPILHVEKLGGLAGFGTGRSHIRSRGQIDSTALSSADRDAVDKLFRERGLSHGAGADQFRFRLSRTIAGGTETIEAPESAVPAAVASCVRDELT